MKLFVEDADVGIRLDVWLSTRIEELSRSRIQSLLKAGHITSEERNLSPHSKTVAGMTIDVDIPPPEPVELVAENIPLNILYEDNDLIVINKPAGMVVHPAAGHSSGTLVNALLYHCKDLAGIGGELRPGIVHRLDKDTSGVMVAAKNEQSMEKLSSSFKDREVTKEYQSVVHGIPSQETGTIETEIGRSRHDRKKMSTSSQSGRHAVTHYRIIKAFKDTALLGLRIETGRTHQIRVHMTHIGHPVVGDGQYGSHKRDNMLGGEVERQMLHAFMLTFKHPVDDREIACKAPLPEDMKDLINFLESE